MPSTVNIRTRIAPSPTGPLHIGTARTALFNWLFARHHGGEFILRIEDTDLERSDPKYEKDIIDGLKWLGIDWDGEIIRQSERTDIYKKYIQQLLDEKFAYYCFCSKEELEEQRQAMLAQGLPPRYTGKCRSLSEQEVKEKLNRNEPHIIRFKVPNVKIAFKDLIRGEIEFDAGLIGDIAIAKNINTPLYNFAVVVDDYETAISHVIRGEDHIANTPKQILLQKALKFPQPKYAHLPLILNPDKSKLSKRHAPVSINEYRKQGYLPEAMINFLAFLGWHPEQEEYILSRQKLIETFSLDRVQKSGAVFDKKKLDWINSQYIKKMSDDELATLLNVENKKIIQLIKDRIKKLSDFYELAGFFTKLPDYDADLLIWKKTSKEDTLRNLKDLVEIIKKGGGEKEIMDLAKKRGNGEVLWPMRAALSGMKASPGPIEIMDVLGREETIRRLLIAIDKLS